jgi:hypothetical protein
MEIDWRKAPEDATHFVISAEARIPSGWYQADGNKMRDLSREGEYTFRLDDLHDDRPLRLAPRPNQWNGEGLPPVGMVCERMWMSGPASYTPVRVIAHDSGQAIYRFIEDRRKGEVQADSQGEGDSSGNPIFRPIRTPEQIAAEERDKGIEVIRELLSNVACDDFHAAVAIYDAGYRKQEPNK